MKQKNKNKRKTKGIFVFMLLALLLVFASGCGVKVPQYEEENANQVLKDRHFSNGFDVTAFNANESKGVPIGQLKYGGEALGGQPLWRLAQWGCTKNLLDSVMTKQGFRYTYADGGKTVAIDCETGAISLGMDGDAEFEGRVRKDGEEWPHLLIEQGSLDSGKFGALDKLYLEIEFTLTEFENLMKTTDMREYHSAQFQWFVTLSNANQASPDFKKSMWFGMGFFDRRYDYPPMFAAQDGGKEDNTGMFIYIIDSKKYLKQPVTVGQSVVIRYDILPQVKAGLNIAKSRNFLKNTNFEDLQLGSTNIGWEITGNFNASVQIDKLSIEKVLK